MASRGKQRGRKRKPGNRNRARAAAFDNATGKRGSEADLGRQIIRNRRRYGVARRDEFLADVRRNTAAIRAWWPEYGGGAIR